MIDLDQPPDIKTFGDAFEYIAATASRETGTSITGEDVYNQLPDGEFWHIPYWLENCIRINAERLATDQSREDAP